MIARLIARWFPNWANLLFWRGTYERRQAEIRWSGPFNYDEFASPISTDRFGRWWWHDETGDLYGPYKKYTQAAADLDRYCEEMF